MSVIPKPRKLELFKTNSILTLKRLYTKLLNRDEAKRILDKLEFDYTPKHGSWLNMAEIELSVLNRQCLNRRLPDQDTLKLEIAAWEQDRNQRYRSVDWRFTSADARIKLKQLYPSIQT